MIGWGLLHLLCAGAVVYGPVFFLASLAPSFPSVPLFLSLLSLPLRGVVPWWVHPARVRGTYSFTVDGRTKLDRIH